MCIYLRGSEATSSLIHKRTVYRVLYLFGIGNQLTMKKEEIILDSI